MSSAWRYLRERLERLADYFELIQQDNPLLHLVAPCTPEEFAIRHILESLTMAKFMPTGRRFADIGTGAGLPAIPCLLAREDLRATLIESKEKKAAFLSKAAAALDLTSRVEIVNRQFDEVRERGLEFVSCRGARQICRSAPETSEMDRQAHISFFWRAVAR